MSNTSVSIGHQNIPYFWPVVYQEIRESIRHVEVSLIDVALQSMKKESFFYDKTHRSDFD